MFLKKRLELLGPSGPRPRLPVRPSYGTANGALSCRTFFRVGPFETYSSNVRQGLKQKNRRHARLFADFSARIDDGVAYGHAVVRRHVTTSGRERYVLKGITADTVERRYEPTGPGKRKTRSRRPAVPVETPLCPRRSADSNTTNGGVATDYDRRQWTLWALP